MKTPEVCTSPSPLHFLNDVQENRKPVKKTLYVCLSHSHTAAKNAAVLPCDDPKFQWVVCEAQQLTYHPITWQGMNRAHVFLMMISRVCKLLLCYIWEKTKTSTGILTDRKLDCPMSSFCLQFPDRQNHDNSPTTCKTTYSFNNGIKLNLTLSLSHTSLPL